MPERVARECAAFYELIGFAQVEPPPSLADRALWLASGPTSIHLQYAESTGDSGPGHVAIVVPEYASRLGVLRAAGVAVDERAPHWGSPRCYVRDPAGNRLELMEFPPIAS
ncbi:MAG: hypothetical protein ACRDKI_04655 [Solirubrobacterales bacterium]